MSRTGLSLLLVLLTAAAAYGELPNTPVILEARVVGCESTTEVCGDGIDQDCDSADLPCPGNDRDWDGHVEGADCNDHDRNVFPGVAVPCNTSCGEGTKVCQLNGAYSGCSCQPLCEAPAGGRCFYISKLTGSNANPGTFDRPFRTAEVLTAPACDLGTCPATTIDLRPGDHIYLLTGVYDESFRYYGNERFGLVLRGVSGTAAAPIVLKAYPGHYPVLAPRERATALYLYQSGSIRVEGLEIARAYQAGVRLGETSDIELRGLTVHDTDGVDNDNIAGIFSVNHHDLRIRHCTVHDNYDRTNADTLGLKTENSRNIVLFGGGSATIERSVIYQSLPTTAPKTGGCITYKHPATTAGATFEVAFNVLRGCAFHAIGFSTYGGRIHHNLIVDSEEAVVIKQIGGPAELHDTIIEHNTIVGSPGLLLHTLVDRGSFGPHTFRRNIVVHHGSYRPDTGGIIAVDPYGDDSRFESVVTAGMLHIDDNCYFNPAQELRFGLFSVNSAAANSLGGLYTFSQWQALGYDRRSLAADPQLDATHYPRAPGCSAMGR